MRTQHLDKLLLQRLQLLFLVTLAATVMFAALAFAEDSKEEKPLPIDIFHINATGGTIKFQLEIANTQESRRKGLMFREKLDRYRGLILDYGRAVRAGVWMKNVAFPLDLIFVAPNGTVESIASRTVPNSTETIRSVKKVRAVIEINGGLAEKFAIRPGDVVVHKIFNNAE